MEKSRGTLFARWERVLAKEGLAPLGEFRLGGRHVLWTDEIQGGMDMVVGGMRSRDPLHDLPKAMAFTPADTGKGEFWRLASARVASLPHEYPHRRVLEKICETGNIARAAKESGLSKRVVEKVWKRVVTRLLDPEYVPSRPRPYTRARVDWTTAEARVAALPADYPYRTVLSRACATRNVTAAALEAGEWQNTIRRVWKRVTANPLDSARAAD